MTKLSWRIKLGAGLLSAFLAMLGAHFLIFRDWHHLAIFTLHDVAFLPFEVLIVTMILHELLEHRARRERVRKLSMVIGAFFSEVGSELLRRLSVFDTDRTLRDLFSGSAEWDAGRIATTCAALSGHGFALDAARGDLAALRSFLQEKRGFLLRLLENPNLLEHESFTDALWAVFHLAEELEHRTDLGRLGANDLGHLSGDVKRAYSTLIIEWLGHLRHLKESYPYLFSLAVRRNPLDPEARVALTD